MRGEDCDEVVVAGGRDEAANQAPRHPVTHVPLPRRRAEDKDAPPDIA